MKNKEVWVDGWEVSFYIWQHWGNRKCRRKARWKKKWARLGVYY